MKALLIVGFLFAAAQSAHANPSEVFACSSTGDALESVSVAVNSASDETDTLLVTVKFPSAETASLTSDMKKTKLAKGLKKGRMNVTLRSPTTKEFGGALSDAALLVLKKNKDNADYEAKLALNGSVYKLNCKTAAQ